MKRHRIILFILILPFLFTPVFAENEAEAYGEDLWEILPEETKELLSDMGIDSLDYSTVTKIDSTELISFLLPSIKRSIGYPLKQAGLLIAALLVCMIAGTLTENTSAISKVSVGVCGLLLLSPFASVLSRMTGVIGTSTAFMQAYVPIYGGLTAASGQVSGATAYSAFLLLVCSLLESLSKDVILPLSGMLLALSAVTSIEETAASGVADLISRGLKWGLTLISVIAGAVFSLQTSFASVSDGVTLRSAKLAASSFIPIVGGTLSEALGTVVSAASVIRSTAGTVGIIAIMILILPMLTELVMWMAVCKLLAFFASSCKEKRLESLFSKTAGTVGVLVAITALSGAVFIFATALTVKTGTGI